MNRMGVHMQERRLTRKLKEILKQRGLIGFTVLVSM